MLNVLLVIVILIVLSLPQHPHGRCCSIHTGDAAAHVSRLLTVKQTMHHSGDILKLLNFHVSFLHRLMAGEFRL